MGPIPAWLVTCTVAVVTVGVEFATYEMAGWRRLGKIEGKHERPGALRFEDNWKVLGL